MKYLVLLPFVILLLVPIQVFSVVGNTHDYSSAKIALKDRLDHALQEEKKIKHQFDETFRLTYGLTQNQSIAYYAQDADFKSTAQKLKNDILQLKKVDKSITTSDKYLKMADTTWHTIGPLIASNSPNSQIDKAIKNTDRHLTLVEHNQETNHAILDYTYTELAEIYDRYYGKMDRLAYGPGDSPHTPIIKPHSKN